MLSLHELTQDHVLVDESLVQLQIQLIVDIYDVAWATIGKAQGRLILEA